jgi:hypothetical protein
VLLTTFDFDELKANSLSALSICQQAIASGRTTTQFPLTSQYVAALAIDTQEEFLRSLGLDALDLLQLTIVVVSDISICDRPYCPDRIAELIYRTVLEILSSASNVINQGA